MDSRSLRMIKVYSNICILQVFLTIFFVLGVRFLYYSRISSLFFWCGYLFISYITILNITSNSSNNQKLFSIIMYSLSIHLIVPLVQPVGVVWDSDAIHAAQSAQLITEQKIWIPGIGTGSAKKFCSYYPSLPLLETFLNYLTSIDVPIIQQYLMLIYAPLFLTGFFLFMRKAIANSDLAILSTFFYATNPVLVFMTTYTAYQGLGYILMSFILALYIRPKKRITISLSYFLSIILILTHPLSSYNLIFFFVIVSIFSYISKQKSVNFNIHVKLSFILFLLVSLASWLIFIAIVSSHADTMLELIQSLLKFHTAIEGELLHLHGSKGSFFERFFNYIGLAIFVCLCLIGGVTSWRVKRRLEFYLSIFGISIGFIVYYILPTHLHDRDFRYRLLDYAYLYLIPAAVIGALQIGSILSHKFRGKGLYVYTILILLITPSTIITLIPEPYYTAHPPLTKSNDVFLYSMEWMATAQWVGHFVPSNIKISGYGFTHYISGVARREINRTYFLDFISHYGSTLTDQNFLIVIDNTILKFGSAQFNFSVEDLKWIQSDMNLLYNNYHISNYLKPKKGYP